MFTRVLALILASALFFYLPAPARKTEASPMAINRDKATSILLPGEFTIKGRLEGYDPATHPTTLTLMLEDNLTGDSYERVLPVGPDGSFGRTLTIPSSRQITTSDLPPRQ
ncbi:MAG: hypothetical protein NC342_08025 [Pseudoflavonifractor sp.]|nr:hypothetical protein [Alloprevotella sp.]MCM1117468.1 hypothetical protein [Pseudoflavonifractor sp.]